MLPSAPNPPTGERIFIRGVGLVTPLGHSAWQTFRALLAGRTLTDRAAALPDDIAPVDLVRALGGVSIARHAAGDPAIDLAERAAREALHGLDPAGMTTVIGASKGAVQALAAAADRFRVSGFGFRVSGNHVAATCPAGSGVGNSKLETRNSKLASAVALGPHGYLAAHLRERLGLGPVHSVVAACASSLTALHLARLMLLDAANPDRPRRVLVLTAEAALLPLFIHSYRRLGVLPPLTPAGYRARPLDQRRCGFLLAEQAAAVVLERGLSPNAQSAEHLGTDPLCASRLRKQPTDDAGYLANRASHRGSVPVCSEDSTNGDRPCGGDRPCPELLATAIAADSFDLVRPAPAMPALTRVATELLAGRHIDVIHPHATGTQDQDAHELAVYERVLGSFEFRVSGFELGNQNRCAVSGAAVAPTSSTRNSKLETRDYPGLYACKGALGHGLGAAGLTALVLACLCARTGQRPPMPWLEHPIDSPLLRGSFPNSKPETRNPKLGSTHAIFAAGFGGHVAGAVIRNVERGA